MEPQHYLEGQCTAILSVRRDVWFSMMNCSTAEGWGKGVSKYL